MHAHAARDGPGSTQLHAACLGRPQLPPLHARALARPRARCAAATPAQILELQRNNWHDEAGLFDVFNNTSEDTSLMAIEPPPPQRRAAQPPPKAKPPPKPPGSKRKR